jgi:2-methylisocitrate lyase-like PEP mutase family enzyme
MPTTAEKRRDFRRLHETGCFVIPNPWDIGGARVLQALGFKAIATTSAGLAFSLGLPDNAVARDLVLDHCRAMAEASDLPVNADFENGFADRPEVVAENVRLCVATGVAGLSIEDATGKSEQPLYDFDLAVERIKAARAAIDATGGDTILVARSEVFFTKHAEPLGEAIRRLTAFAEAGADCLYAPGAVKREEITAIVGAVAPKPVNVLAHGPIGLSVADLAGFGVRRISVGGALARAAWGGFLKAARQIAGEGRFEAFAEAASSKEIVDLFANRRNSA